MTKSVAEVDHTVALISAANLPIRQSLSADSFTLDTRRQRVLLSQLFRHRSEPEPYIQITISTKTPPPYPSRLPPPASFFPLSVCPLCFVYSYQSQASPFAHQPKHTQSPVTGNTPRHWNHHVSAVRPCANPQRRPLRSWLRQRQQRRQRLCYWKSFCHNDFAPWPVNGSAELRWSVPRGFRRLSPELRRRPPTRCRNQSLRL